MIYTELTKKALKIAYEAHKDQTDKSGMPYIFHPLHLAEQMSTEDEIVVALLHDVVEDTEVIFEELSSQGFPHHIIESLSLLTHDVGVKYMDYIRSIKACPIATKVKLADLRHNSDMSRLDKVTKKAKSRVEKYRKAIDILMVCEKCDNYKSSNGRFCGQCGTVLESKEQGNNEGETVALLPESIETSQVETIWKADRQVELDEKKESSLESVDKVEWTDIFNVEVWGKENVYKIEKPEMVLHIPVPPEAEISRDEDAITFSKSWGEDWYLVDIEMNEANAEDFSFDKYAKKYIDGQIDWHERYDHVTKVDFYKEGNSILAILYIEWLESGEEGFVYLRIVKFKEQLLTMRMVVEVAGNRGEYLKAFGICEGIRT